MTDWKARAEKAESERDHWKHNHDHIKARIALLLDRPDLPQARKNIQQIMADRIEQAESALAQAIAERDRMVRIIQRVFAEQCMSVENAADAKDAIRRASQALTTTTETDTTPTPEE